MKIKDYKPKDEGEAIGWLLEECLETGIAIGKCLRFGPDNKYEGLTNRQHLMDELDDLETALHETRLHLKESDLWSEMSKDPIINDEPDV